MKKKLIFKKLIPIDKRQLQTRKKIKIFEGVDLKSYYFAIFFVEQKSRILTKHVKEIEEIFERLKDFRDHNFKKKIFIYNAPICSKAKEELKKTGWRVINASS